MSFLCAPLLACAAALPANSQNAISAATDVHLITQQQPILLAQAANPAPGVLPTDATKTGVQQERNLIDPGWRLRYNQFLPSRLYYTISCETTQRLDTNVFLNYKMPQPDYVFRVQPSAQVGYNIFSNTSVYASYFSIKDNYTVHNRGLSNPVTQSVQVGLRHYWQPKILPKFQFTLDGSARELWQSMGLRQADLIPSLSLNYFAGPRTIFYASTLMQLRSQELFLGAKREIDPFYTIGFFTGKGPWSFSFSDTLVTNFREPHFRYSVPHQGNVSMIADFEIDRALFSKHIQGLQAFVRAEPVFNWRSSNVRGLSGFDFRLYSGVRMTLQKMSYLSTINQIKKSLQQQDDAALNKAKGKKGKGGKNGGSPTQKPDGTNGDTTPGTTDKENTGSNPSTTVKGDIASADDNVLFPNNNMKAMVPVAGTPGGAAPMFIPVALRGPIAPTAVPAVVFPAGSSTQQSVAAANKVESSAAAAPAVVPAVAPVVSPAVSPAASTSAVNPPAAVNPKAAVSPPEGPTASAAVPSNLI